MFTSYSFFIKSVIYPELLALGGTGRCTLKNQVKVKQVFFRSQTHEVSTETTSLEGHHQVTQYSRSVIQDF